VQAAPQTRAAGARPDCQSAGLADGRRHRQTDARDLAPKILQLEALEKQGATPEQIDQFLAQPAGPPP